MEEEKDLQSLYGAVSNKFDVGTYDEFKSKMDTPEKRKSFYDVVSSNGFDLGDYQSYEQRLKKKESSDSSEPEKNLELPGAVGEDISSDSKEVTDIPPLGRIAIRKYDENKSYLDNIDEKEKEKVRSYGSELFNALKAGSTKLGESVLAAPEFLYDTAAQVTNPIMSFLTGEKVEANSEGFKDYIGIENKLKDYYAEQHRIVKNKNIALNKKYEEGVYDSFKSGNYADGFRQIGSSFAESLPSTLSIMVGGAYTKAPQVFAGTSIVFGADKNEELKKQGKSVDERVLNAWGTGMAEGVFESIGTGSVGRAAKELILREGSEKGGKILQKGLATAYKNSLKKFGLLTAPIGEGVEELATQITQNAIDKNTGIDPDRDILDGAMDSFLIGIGSGGVYGLTLQGIKSVSSKKSVDNESLSLIENYDLEKVKTKVDDLVSKKELTQEEGNEFIDRLKSIKSNNQKVPENITGDNRNKAIDLLIEKEKIEKSIEGKDPSLVNSQKERINQINTELGGLTKTDSNEQKSKEDTKKESKQEVVEPSPESKKESTEIDDFDVFDEEEIGPLANETKEKRDTNVDDSVRSGTPSGKQENIQSSSNIESSKRTVEKPIISDNLNYQILRGETGNVEVQNRDGSKAKVTPATKRKYEQEYIEKTDFDTGERAIQEGFNQDVDVSEYVANNSNNAKEVAETLVTEDFGVELDPVQVSIAENVKNSVAKSSFDSFVGKQGEGVSTSYFSKEGKGLDEIAMEVEYDVYGDYNANQPRVTEQDVADFMMTNKGSNEYLNQQNPNKFALEEKFRELTGLKPTKSNVNLVSGINSKNSIISEQNQEIDDEVPFDKKGSRNETPTVKIKEAEKLLKHLSKRHGIEGTLKDMGFSGILGSFDRKRLKIDINSYSTLDENGNFSAALESTGNISRRTIFHEYLHPFVEVLEKENPELYNKIYEGAKLANEKESFTDVSNYQDKQQKEELVVRYLDRLSDNDTRPTLLKQFLDWLSNLFYSNRKNKSADLAKLDTNTTVEDLYKIFKNYGNLKEEISDIIKVDKIKEQIDFYNELLSIEGLNDSTKKTYQEEVKNLENQLSENSIKDKEKSRNLAKQNTGDEISKRSSQGSDRSQNKGSIESKITDRLQRGVEKANREFRSRQKDGATNEKISLHDQIDIEKRIALDFAKENDLWVEDLYSLGQSLKGGIENTLALNPDTGALYKSNNLFNSRFLISNLLDQVQKYNEVFPETKYEVIGFTGIDNGIKRSPHIEVILKQAFVDNAVPATPSEINNYMKSIGFNQLTPTSYTNGKVIVSDLFPRNVLKKNGQIYVVDSNVIDYDDYRFSIIGEKGGRRFGIDKINSLSVAKEMEAKGRTAEEIYFATGWERGVDGKWRFELYDGDVTFKDHYNGSLDEVIDYPELFKAFPKAKKIEVVFNPNLDGSGMFVSDKNRIYINPTYSKAEQLATILHEIQHFIQKEEGFASGTSPEFVKQSIEEKVKSLYGDSPVKKSLTKLLDALGARKIDKNSVNKELSFLKDQLPKSEFELYQSAAGEVEARNVEARRDMSMEERAKKTLASTEDIAREDQILLESSLSRQMSTGQQSFSFNNDELLQKTINAYNQLQTKMAKINAIRKDYSDYVKKALKSDLMTDFRKQELNTILRGIEKAKTKETLEKELKKVEDIVYRLKGRALMSKINGIFKRKLTKIESGRIKANLTDVEATNIINGAKKILKEYADNRRGVDDKKTYDKDFIENLQDEVNGLVLKNDLGPDLISKNIALNVLSPKITSDERVKFNMLEKAYNELAEIYDEGRSRMKDWVEAKKQEKEEWIREALEDVNPKNKSLLKTENELKNQNKTFIQNISRGLYQLFNGFSMADLDSYFRVLSKSKSEDSFGGYFLGELSPKLRAAETNKSYNLRKHAQNIKQAQKRIYGSEYSMIKTLSKQYVMDVNRGGEVLDIPFTKGKLINLWMNYKNSELHSGFEANGYDSEFMSKVDDLLNKKDKEYADFLFDFYDNYWYKVNDVYENMYGYPMGKPEFYAGRVYRDGYTEAEADMMTPGNIARTTAGASTKSRVANNNAIDAIDVNQAVARHIKEMEHFINFAEVYKEYDAVVRDKKVRRAVLENDKSFGDIVLSGLEYYRDNDLVRGGYQSETIKLMDKFMSNYVKAVLSVKPKIAVTQMLSFINGASFMPSGLKYFAKGYNPKTYIEDAVYLTKNSKYLNNRLDTKELNRALSGLDTVSIDTGDGLSSNSTIKAMTKTAAKGYDQIQNMLMYNVKFGDFVGVMGTVPVYTAWKQKYLDQGMSEEVANDKAIKKFETAVDRAQQSQSKFGKSKLQRNVVGRYFSMFATSPMQNYRNAQSSYIELLRWMKGQEYKGAPVRNMMSILNYSFAQPMLYVYMSNLFAGTLMSFFDSDEEPTEDDKALMSAVIIRNSNSIPILGNALLFLTDKYALEKDYTFGGIFNNALFDSAGKIKTYLDRYEKARNEETKAKYKDLIIIEASQLLSGLPFKTAEQYRDLLKNWEDINDEYDAVEKMGLVGGYSQYMVDKRKKERKRKSSKDKPRSGGTVSPF